MKSKPDSFAPGDPIQGHSDRPAMTLASQNLLRALWKAHAPILKAYQAQGLNVAKVMIG